MTEPRRYPYGRPAEGATLHVPAYGTCTVLPHTDPSLVRLLTSHGAEVKIGHKALHLALIGPEAEGTPARDTTEKAPADFEDGLTRGSNAA